MRGVVLRPDQVRVREKGWVDLLVGDEVLELERVTAALDLSGLEVLVVEVYELALADLEALTISSSATGLCSSLQTFS